MKKVILLSVLLLFFADILRSNDGISAIRWNNEFEKQIFCSASKGIYNNDFLSLLMVTDAGTTCQDFVSMREKIEAIALEFEKRFQGKPSTEKSIRFLHNYLQKNILKQYEEQAGMSDLLRNGKYQCSTATALYAVVFSRCKIDFELQITPTHIFPVAFTAGGDAIKLETTAGKNGFMRLDPANQEEIKDFFQKENLVMGSRVNGLTGRRTAAGLGDEMIDCAQLAGVLYYNQAVNAAEKQDYRTSCIALTKAWYWYKSPIVEFVLRKNFSTLCESLEFDVEKDLKEVAALVFFVQTDNNAKKSFLLYVERLSEHFLLKNNDIQSFKTIFQLLYSDLSEGAVLKSELSCLENYFLSQYSYYSGQYNSAFENAEKALRLNPNDLRIRHWFATCTSAYLSAQSDLEKGLVEWNNLKENYTWLVEHDLVKNYEPLALLRLSVSYYEIEEPQKGDSYLSAFEQSAAWSAVSKAQIAYTFRMAAKYYISKNKTDEAAKIVQRGLLLAPEDELLKKLYISLN